MNEINEEDQQFLERSRSSACVFKNSIIKDLD